MISLLGFPGKLAKNAIRDSKNYSLFPRNVQPYIQKSSNTLQDCRRVLGWFNKLLFMPSKDHS